MFITDYLPQDCLTFDNYDDAVTVQKILLRNGYCTMMGQEEQLITLNWIWTDRADRNGVIFIDRGLYDSQEDEWIKHHPEVNWGAY